MLRRRNEPKACKRTAGINFEGHTACRLDMLERDMIRYEMSARGAEETIASSKHPTICQGKRYRRFLSRA